MPDGDRHYDSVAPYCKSAYKKACEGTLTSNDVLKMLTKGLHLYGNPPVQLIQQFHTELQDSIGVIADWSDIDLPFLNRHLERTAARLRGNKRGLAFALDSCREWMQLEDTDVRNWKAGLFRIYLTRMYNGDLVDRIPLSLLHRDVAPQDVEKLLGQLEPDVAMVINRLAARLISANGDVKRVQKPSVKHEKLDSMEDDLLGNFGSVS